MKFFTNNSNETLKLGKKLGLALKPGAIIALNGDLAAGKTVLAKGIALALEIKEDVTSPTYNIVCEYSGILPMYHMDLYRISDYDEFEMLGVDHLLYGKGITIIEWSERILDELPENIININITRVDNTDKRIIDIEGIEL
ncbi:MAG: tRNA (adenosine(37)-N6)-threonylcarbamoyltransferase complex ATPase subunit type 1 TsaE [Spirochaetales bacterium]|nr:tRNA (adenosine(37)-N6)-threonylcarbamoyltransferase complex ATPase subunit type 1 TsaE [Spirochaetales bacterium]